jgi:hypothetical protein
MFKIEIDNEVHDVVMDIDIYALLKREPTLLFVSFINYFK